MIYIYDITTFILLFQIKWSWMIFDPYFIQIRNTSVLFPISAYWQFRIFIFIFYCLYIIYPAPKIPYETNITYNNQQRWQKNNTRLYFLKLQHLLHTTKTMAILKILQPYMIVKKLTNKRSFQSIKTKKGSLHLV